MAKRGGLNINIITRGAKNTNSNAESPHQLKFQKAIPENIKYDLVKQK
jgi:hypothetical protein